MPLANKHKAVAEMLVVIVSRGKSKKVIEILQEENVDLQILSMGSGTAASNVGDMFNLDSLEREVLFAIINIKNKKAINDKLKEMFDEGKTTGIAFSVPIKSATSDLVERLGYKL